MRNKTTIDIFAYWDALRRGRDVPNRSDIDPSQVRHILADLFILEMTDAGEIRFRLAGTRICALFARELRGSRFDSIWRGEQTAQLAEIAAHVMATTTPVVMSAAANIGTSDRLPAELVLLPLRSPDGGVDRIIGSLTPLSRPAWLEATPVNFLDLKGVRQLELPSSPPGQPRDPTGAKPPVPTQGAITGALRRVLHLRVLEGGRRD